MKTGIELVAEERKRQIEVEGWDEDHDDGHSAGAMAVAGACYALDVYSKDTRPVFKYGIQALVNDLWPWSRRWWKPTPEDPVRQLVKAGALICAEIDRLKRQGK